MRRPGPATKNALSAAGRVAPLVSKSDVPHGAMQRPGAASKKVLSAARCVALLGLAAGPVVLGCGSAAPGAKASDTAPVRELSDADSATAELNRAEGELDALFGPAGSATAAAEAPAASVSPTYAEPPRQPTTTTQSAPAPMSGKSAGGETRASDACGVACRALASMARAANHLCGLSGETDTTCESARDRLKNASTRVAARCTCP